MQQAVTYDWRLAVPNLEIRDSYFSRLKNSVEEFKRIHKEKVQLPPAWPRILYSTLMAQLKALHNSMDDTMYLNI